jgi:alcohol dehydrogenase
MDAIVHAVETAGSTRRTPRSLELSHAAWALLHRAFPRVMVDSADEPARADMLLGAHLAGAAIEESMLGAAHACANPLTAHFGTIHGVAVGLMLPHVVRFNSAKFNPYAAILPDPPALADLLDQLLAVAGLPRRLRDLHVPAEALAALAAEAAAQWTATFNPVPVGPDELLGIYQAAY